MKAKLKFDVSVCFVLCLFGVALFAGCSSVKPMALESKTGLQLDSESAGLFTLRTSNALKPNYEPEVSLIEIVSEETGKCHKFGVNKPHVHEKDSFCEYLVSVNLPPGRYKIGNVRGVSPNFLTIGSFGFPVGASFELPVGNVVYLGHVSMINRKRNNGEKRSGPVIPLVDQAASGYAGGTFDVSIVDRSEQDIFMFEEKYPEIRKYIISRGIMTGGS